MTRLRLLLLLGLAFVLLLLGAGAGAWWYLFGPNEVEAAELLPANTLVFATIPNATAILAGYQTSQLKKLVDSPNSEPLRDAIAKLVGTKNVDLLNDFLPNLSGQSFIAITHFDVDNPGRIGLIAAMKPKAGLGDFQTFLEKLKTTWPDLVKQGKTGTGSVAGVDYQWIERPGAPDKLCVAQVRGWIVTSWGEAALQDWLERFQKKSTTSSLAQDMDYQKSVGRVGDDPMALVYVNYHAMLAIAQKQLAKTNPAAADYVAQKLDALGGAALATRFENGEIVDRFSFLMPRPAQLESGLGVDPCPFDTLKFTGPNTRLYWGASINWKQYYKNLQEQSGPSATVNPLAGYLVNFLQTWAADAGLDIQHNIVDPLGNEFSVQAEWNPDTTYPEAGLFVQLDKPDDFKPTIAAIIKSVRKTYALSAVVKEINSNGQNFAALKFVQTSPISPTITEDGPYLGIFLSENQAVRSFQRDATLGLTHNANFNRQVGDKRNGAAQVLFLDSPQLLDHAYRNAMPYLSIASMFNQNLAAMLKGRNLPPDLTWLAPMGTWSCILVPDEEGIQGYSVSGIGNQGILLGAALGGTAGVLQSMGLLPKPARALGMTPVPGTPSVPSTQLPLQVPDQQRSLAPASPAPDDNSLLVGANGAQTSIYITSENKIIFDRTPVPVEQIGDFLKSKKAANQSLKLIVKMDKDASSDILSRVMDAGASAGFGVLPYTYTSGSNSFPPVTNSASAATPPSWDAGPQAAAAGSNAEATPPMPSPATNSAPMMNSNADATPPSPEPAKTQ